MICTHCLLVSGRLRELELVSVFKRQGEESWRFSQSGFIMQGDWPSQAIIGSAPPTRYRKETGNKKPKKQGELTGCHRYITEGAHTLCPNQYVRCNKYFQNYLPDKIS